MQTHWRLAFMFDARGGDLPALEAGLGREAGAIRDAAQGNRVRTGVAIRSRSEGGQQGSHDIASWRTVDGAVEVTIANGKAGTIPEICSAMKPMLDRLAEPGSVEVMTGTMHHIVPVRSGSVFLSLAFRRYPGTTVQEFRNWWHDQHAPLCIPILGEDMLAYDQVHVDEAATRQAADALGASYVDYDAYDNLTYESEEGSRRAASDAQAMARIAEDEEGRIDNSTRRIALMREV